MEKKCINGIHEFSREEYEKRIERARELMTEAKLDGLLITSEQNFRYLTGFVSQFWVSPTRPWYFVLPLEGEPVAVIPEAGVENMRQTSWVSEMRTWISPRPYDEGITLAADELSSCCKKFGRIGAELGPESRLGMPVQDFLRLREAISPLEFVDGSGIMRALRMVKSHQEVARIRQICQIVCDAFDTLPEKIEAGDTERDVCRKLHVDLIRLGADKAPYLIGVTGKGSYSSPIMGPTDRVLESGHVFMIDTGSTFDSYYCDFDRNWAIGTPSDKARRAYDALFNATEAGLAAVRSGNRACDVYRAQAKVLEKALSSFPEALGFSGGGRLGHGIGLLLTEPPSNTPDDETLLIPGMVITVEPVLFFAPSQLMVHEEDLVVTEDGYELLTRRASPELPIIDL